MTPWGKTHLYVAVLLVVDLRVAAAPRVAVRRGMRQVAGAGRHCEGPVLRLVDLPMS